MIVDDNSPDNKASLPRDWRLWVAENALRKCDKPSMFQTMVNAGVAKDIAQQGIEDVMNDPCFEAALRHQQITNKYASIMLNHHHLLTENPAFDQVERRTELSKDEFFEKYYLGNRPVIISDFAKNWPALQLWTPQFFKEKYGHIQVQAQMGRDKNNRYEEEKLNHKQFLSMGNFVDQVETLGRSNDIYITANNDALRDTQLHGLLDDIGVLPDYMDPSRLALDTSLWFGPAGTVTPLHHDPVNLFHAQIVGRKRWRFIHTMQAPLLYNFYTFFSPVDIDAPDYERFPLFKKARILDVIVEPGEAVFLPLAWWHHVVSLDTCISLSFGNVAFNNTFEYENPNLFHWF